MRNIGESVTISTQGLPMGTLSTWTGKGIPWKRPSKNRHEEMAPKEAILAHSTVCGREQRPYLPSVLFDVGNLGLLERISPHQLFSILDTVCSFDVSGLCAFG
jgi:hypothetical protein